MGSDPTPFQWFRLLPKLAKHPNANYFEAGASLYGWDFEELRSNSSGKVILGWEKLLIIQKSQIISVRFIRWDYSLRKGSA